MKEKYLIFLACFCLLSCSRNTAIYEMMPENGSLDEVVGDEFLEFRAIYRGQNEEYQIYEVEIKNFTGETIPVHFDDFELYSEYETEDKQNTYSALSSIQLIDLLAYYAETEKKNRKNSIWSAIVTSVGIGLITDSWENGLNVGIDNSFDLIRYDQDSKKYIRSVEEEMAYLESTVLYKETIRPGETGHFDVLFPPLPFDGLETITANIFGGKYILDFQE